MQEKFDAYPFGLYTEHDENYKPIFFAPADNDIHNAVAGFNGPGLDGADNVDDEIPAELRNTADELSGADYADGALYCFHNRTVRHVYRHNFRIQQNDFRQ